MFFTHFTSNLSNTMYVYLIVVLADRQHLFFQTLLIMSADTISLATADAYLLKNFLTMNNLGLLMQSVFPRKKRLKDRQ